MQKSHFQSHLPSQAAKGHTLRVVAFVAEDGVGLARASLTIGKEAAVPQWASAPAEDLPVIKHVDQ